MDTALTQFENTGIAETLPSPADSQSSTDTSSTPAINPSEDQSGDDLPPRRMSPYPTATDRGSEMAFQVARNQADADRSRAEIRRTYQENFPAQVDRRIRIRQPEDPLSEGIGSLEREVQGNRPEALSLPNLPTSIGAVQQNLSGRPGIQGRIKTPSENLPFALRPPQREPLLKEGDKQVSDPNFQDQPQ